MSSLYKDGRRVMLIEVGKTYRVRLSNGNVYYGPVVHIFEAGKTHDMETLQKYYGRYAPVGASHKAKGDRIVIEYMADRFVVIPLLGDIKITEG